MTHYQIEIPLKTVSESNTFGHWTVAYKRHRLQKRNIWAQLLKDKPKISLPCIVTLTRIAPRELDSDNLQSAFKYIRDQIAEYLVGKKGGLSDNDPRIKWTYDQIKGNPKQYAICLSIIESDEVFIPIP